MITITLKRLRMSFLIYSNFLDIGSTFLWSWLSFFENQDHARFFSKITCKFLISWGLFWRSRFIFSTSFYHGGTFWRLTNLWKIRHFYKKLRKAQDQTQDFAKHFFITFALLNFCALTFTKDQDFISFDEVYFRIFSLQKIRQPPPLPLFIKINKAIYTTLTPL